MLFNYSFDTNLLYYGLIFSSLSIIGYVSYYYINNYCFFLDELFASPLNPLYYNTPLHYQKIGELYQLHYTMMLQKEISLNYLTYLVESLPVSMVRSSNFNDLIFKILSSI